jgi:hypothetical protein
MATVDASIPLQIQQFKPMSPADLLSLKDLATRAQTNELNLQGAQGVRNALAQPGAVDPSTGVVSPTGVAGVTPFNPQLGFQLTQQREQLRLQDLAQNQKKVEVARHIGESYVSSYDRYLQQTGGNKSEAQRLAREATLASIEDMRRSGAFRASGLDEQNITNLKNLPDPEQARTLVISLGGKIDTGKPMSDIGKVEADYYAGRIDKRTRDEAIAKKNSPTLQMQMANIEISPEDKEFWADILRRGGSLPPGLARSAEGAKLVSEVMRQVTKGKTPTTPQEMLANQAEFGGIKAGSRTLGTRTANIEMAVNEADQFADLALEASNRVPRTQFVPLNKATQAYQKGTGGPEISAFVAANNSFINAYARAISPSGVPTVSDKDHARDMIDTAQTPQQYEAVIKQLKKEMAAAVRSPGIVRGAMREALGAEKKETPMPKAGDVQEGYRFKGGNPADKSNWEKVR